ncbi:hypothetical protein WISP_142802 [Willisornis vidua]|uniref:Uncharacterized protein n=1 Tax=Willisornis vidua TaxID=1566151 RepID=A0ABQ9CRI1_9PASS|nr:hypothetical protein WISP_142802 [Willisornis vidua]
MLVPVLVPVKVQVLVWGSANAEEFVTILTAGFCISAPLHSFVLSVRGNGLVIRVEAGQKQLPDVLITKKMQLPLSSQGREEAGATPNVQANMMNDTFA